MLGLPDEEPQGIHSMFQSMERERKPVNSVGGIYSMSSGDLNDMLSHMDSCQLLPRTVAAGGSL